jgi:hypothetical protein
MPLSQLEFISLFLHKLIVLLCSFQIRLHSFALNIKLIVILAIYCVNLQNYLFYHVWENPNLMLKLPFHNIFVDFLSKIKHEWT